jgi:hypothetical protein
MRYTVEMVSNGMIYIPSFMKTGLGFQTLIWGYTHRHTDRKVISLAYFYFFLIRMVGEKSDNHSWDFDKI